MLLSFMFKILLLTLEDFEKNLLKYTKNPIHQNDLLDDLSGSKYIDFLNEICLRPTVKCFIQKLLLLFSFLWILVCIAAAKPIVIWTQYFIISNMKKPTVLQLQQGSKMSYH